MTDGPNNITNGMDGSVAFVFPTFAMRREEYRLDVLPGFNEVLEPLAERASAVVEITSRTFDFHDRSVPPAGLAATLQAHYACYIESVALAAWLEPRVGACDSAAGYSMGVFAALGHAGAIAFEDGLTLMHELCVAVHGAVPPGAYAMGAIDGLPPDAVAEIASSQPQVEIIDIYGAGTTIVSGREAEVAAVLDACARRGATYTRLTPATAPYHSTALSTVHPILEERLRHALVRSPRCRVISALTQQPVASPDDVRVEIASNVTRAMNWYGTMRALLQSGMTVLCECGPSAALSNMAKRDVPGSYRIQDLRAS
jgi:malonyl CoA-acyl carrier protein transacylase